MYFLLSAEVLDLVNRQLIFRGVKVPLQQDVGADHIHVLGENEMDDDLLTAQEFFSTKLGVGLLETGCAKSLVDLANALMVSWVQI